eukprot:390059_1
MAATENKFTKLSNIPINNNDPIRVSHILSLNETELLIIIRYWHYPRKLKEIWIYNIWNDNYTKLIDEKSVNKIIQFYTASLNNNKSFLYLFGESGKIIKLNLKAKQFEVSNRSYHCGSNSRSLFINGQFHIFGGWDAKDKYHFILDENKKELIKVYFFEQIEGILCDHFIHYFKTKNSVLIIPNECKDIYLYSLSTNKCQIYPIQIPEISLPRGV